MNDPAMGAAFANTHDALLHAARWLHIALQAAGGLSITIGFVVMASRLIPRVLRGDLASITAERLVLARALALALELQLATDVIDTALEPSWQQLGQLAAIAAIRTLLNMSLTREITEERKRLEEGQSPQRAQASGATAVAAA